MLISLKVEHGRLFTDLRAIVVDEVHAFAGTTTAGICWRCWSG